jgi:uncharacterized protein
MKIGIFGDTHDHVDNMRHAVSEFNQRECELVIFAGDFVSPIVVPPLRRLQCPFIGCFGDSDGNKIGIQGGMRIIGALGEPPFGICTNDGTKILLTHELEDVKGMLEGIQVIISSHSHSAGIQKDKAGRLFINPGEASGWTYRKPSVAILETSTMEAEIISLPEMPAKPEIFCRSDK